MSVTPYLLLPGTAAEALEFYSGVFGGEVEKRSYDESGRIDGAPDQVAHGLLTGPVRLFVADAGAAEDAATMSGMFFALRGSASAEATTAWFEALAASGRVIEPLRQRPLGDCEGQVIDQFGVRWLLGYAME